jgi:hypothetical protein
MSFPGARREEKKGRKVSFLATCLSSWTSLSSFRWEGLGEEHERGGIGRWTRRRRSEGDPYDPYLKHSILKEAGRTSKCE